METEDGRIMEIDKDGNLVTPTALPIPATPAPADADPPAPPAAPAIEAPASAITGEDMDDSGDDSDNDTHGSHHGNGDDDAGDLKGVDTFPFMGLIFHLTTICSFSQVRSRKFLIFSYFTLTTDCTQHPGTTPPCRFDLFILQITQYAYFVF